MKHDLPPFSPVDGAGKFTADAGENLEGLPVLSKGSDEIAERLEASGHLLLKEPYGHRYPYDWRTKKPVLMRATDQWFASVDSRGDRADVLAPALAPPVEVPALREHQPSDRGGRVAAPPRGAT